jgi:hypothetical protein
LTQVQRKYLAKSLGSLKPVSPGITLAIIIAVLLAILEAVYGFLTVPHELGHVWAARMLGHEVSVFQVDFLDQTRGVQSFFDDFVSGASEFVTGTAAPTPPPPSLAGTLMAPEQMQGSGKVQDYSKDGRLGFVLYEPHVILLDVTNFHNISSYNDFAGASCLFFCPRIPCKGIARGLTLPAQYANICTMHFPRKGQWPAL